MAGFESDLLGNAIANFSRIRSLYLWRISCFIILCLTIFFLSKGIRVSCFVQSRLRQSHWFPDGMIRLTFKVLMSICGDRIQAIGVVLMAALCESLRRSRTILDRSTWVLVILAGVFSAISGVFGTYIYLWFRRIANWPWVSSSFLFWRYLLSLCTKKGPGALSLYFPKKFIWKRPRDHLLKLALQRNWGK